MKKTLALILTIAMIASVAMLAGCGAKKDAGTATEATKAAEADAAKTYVIYSDNAFAPFEYLDTASNSYVGVDMDIMAAIAEDQGIKYEMHNEGFDASMGAVQSGQADAMIAGMT
ncbi:MAG: transporter substrate-binding domain-containing protein, partial [Ruminococcus sp.]|nr:transporter substrate-binding domain-containing protein [Ruminococcus sp.]